MSEKRKARPCLLRSHALTNKACPRHVRVLIDWQAIVRILLRLQSKWHGSVTRVFHKHPSVCTNPTRKFEKMRTSSASSAPYTYRVVWNAGLQAGRAWKERAALFLKMRLFLHLQLVARSCSKLWQAARLLASMAQQAFPSLFNLNS